jgi:hypothetical protein
MHGYATDADQHSTIQGILGVAAYVIVGLVGYLTSPLDTFLQAAVAIPVSWGVLFVGLRQLYDRFLWRHRWIRSVGLDGIPDLEGEWTGYVATAYEGEIRDDALHESNEQDDKMQRVSATLRIKQTWRKIIVHLATEQSSSDSVGATILTEQGRWPSLNYLYENDPQADAEETMERHHGTANLELKAEDSPPVLEGFYYTGPRRENYGRMRFERAKHR